VVIKSGISSFYYLQQRVLSMPFSNSGLDANAVHGNGPKWIGSNGYELVLTLDPMAPEELLKFISCNHKGDCSN